MAEVQRRRDKVILIGYRCTGKTSIGRRLAARLGVPFIDTDEIVEKAAGKSIREMVEEKGWPFFRVKERDAVKTLSAPGKSVIATGGGAVMDERNAAVLKKEGAVIWLHADEQTILKRMFADIAAADQRPPLSSHDLGKEITDTLAVRTPVYRRLADFTVDTGKSDIDGSVEKILRFLAENK